MLKIKNVLDQKVPTYVKSDYYIPIKVRFFYPEFIRGYRNDFETFEYRIFAANNSFVEIKINETTGEIFQLTIVQARDSSKDLRYNFDELPCEEGHIILDLSLLKNEWRDLGYMFLLDVQNNFSIYYKDNNVYILMKEFQQGTKKITLNNIEWLINNDNEIVGFIINNIPSDQIPELEEALFSVTSKKD